MHLWYTFMLNDWFTVTCVTKYQCTITKEAGTEKNWCAVWVKLVCQISTECVIVHI